MNSRISKSIAVVGPTACGKTHRAVEIARWFDGEIISADSRQVYRNMDLGTGKDIEEYEEVPYHMIDICEAGEKYNLYQYLRDFRVCMDDIRARGKRAVICGGSGMYVENALAGIYLPEVPHNDELRSELANKSLEELTEILRTYKSLHNKTDIDTRARAMRAIEIGEYYRKHPVEAERADIRKVEPLDCLILGLEISRDERRKRISDRLEARVNSGMIDEVKALLNKGIHPDNLIYYGLEYKYLTLYVTGKLTRDEMLRQLEIAIHQFAKRQMTWFRGMEKRGYAINWLPYDISPNDLRKFIASHIR